MIAERGRPKFDVKFFMNIEGILTVTAIDKDTKSEKVVQIENTLDIQPEEIEKLKTLAFEFSYEDQQIRNKENLTILDAWMSIFKVYRSQTLKCDKIVLENKRLSQSQREK